MVVLLITVYHKIPEMSTPFSKKEPSVFVPTFTFPHEIPAVV